MPAATFTIREGNIHYMLHPQERTATLILTGVLILLAVMSFLIESAGKEQFATPFSETLEDGTLAVMTGQYCRICAEWRSRESRNTQWTCCQRDRDRSDISRKKRDYH